MVSPELKDFLIVVVGASASFIGLLFVALSFVMRDENKTNQHVSTKRILAESSFAALVNIFFVGLVALTPESNVSYVMITMAIVGFASVAHLIGAGIKGKKTGYRWSILVFSFAIYLFELFVGISAALQHQHLINNSVFTILIFLLFAMSLTRAWELTGIREQQSE